MAQHDPRLLKAGGRVGQLSRQHGPDDPRTIAAKLDVEFVRVELAIDQLVATAPAITPEIADRLRRLLPAVTQEVAA